jgi:hypothetical protein
MQKLRGQEKDKKKEEWVSPHDGECFMCQIKKNFILSNSLIFKFNLLSL